LTFDLSRKETFLHLENWLQEVSTNANETITIILVGTKSDKIAK